MEPFRDDLAAAHAKIARLEAQLAELRAANGVPGRQVRRAAGVGGVLAFLALALAVASYVVIAPKTGIQPCDDVHRQLESCQRERDKMIGAPAREFDRQLANVAMDLAAARASHCYGDAAVAGDGTGHARVTFEPTGTVSNVELDSPPFSESPTGRCVRAAFGTVVVPRFVGPPVTVGKFYSRP